VFTLIQVLCPNLSFLVPPLLIQSIERQRFPSLGFFPSLPFPPPLTCEVVPPPDSNFRLPLPPPPLPHMYALCPKHCVFLISLPLRNPPPGDTRQPFFLRLFHRPGLFQHLPFLLLPGSGQCSREVPSSFRRFSILFFPSPRPCPFFPLGRNSSASSGLFFPPSPRL